MTHLTNVIEEERKVFKKYAVDMKNVGFEFYGYGEETLNLLIEQAMHKSALVVLDELEWKGKDFNSGSEVVTWSDKKREEIRTQLLNNK